MHNFNNKVKYLSSDLSSISNHNVRLEVAWQGDTSPMTLVLKYLPITSLSGPILTSTQPIII